MKVIRVLDSSTVAPILAFRLSEAVDGNPVAEAHVYRAGFGETPADQAGYIVVVHLAPTVRVEWDPYRWGDATLRAAHLHLHAGGYDAVEHGGDLDVRRIREALWRNEDEAAA